MIAAETATLTFQAIGHHMAAPPFGWLSVHQLLI
jgi:hypothetical protein